MIKTKNLAIMFTDMKGFTERTSTQSREQLHHLLQIQDDIIKPEIANHEGTIVKTIGDAFLVTFESPTDAVLCGTAIQKNIIEHNNEAQPDFKMQVRIAINSGEVNIKDDDVFGEPVNIASRIEAIAEPNEIYFTESVYLSMNKNEIPTAEVGHRKLKGIPEEIKVYKVVSEDKLAKANADRQKKAQANANLDKHTVNTNTSEEKSNLLPQKKIKIKKTGSFWQKHKKKIVIIIIVFLILVIIGIAQDKEKIEQELYNVKYSPQEISQKLPELKTEFDKAIKDEDQQKIKALISHLKEISPSLEPVTKKSIKTFLEGQLDNPNLSPRHKQEIRKILEL